MIDFDLKDVSSVVSALGNKAKCYLVGGYVRDSIMGVSTNDIDIEVYGVSPEEVKASLLKQFGEHGITYCGEHFPVFKIRNKIDVALPRREVSTGPGYLDFDTEFDPEMTIEEACSRRDFTINSMMFDIDNRSIVDIYGGQQDLQKNRLHPTSSQFDEDPLRVLRAAKFLSRYPHLRATPDLVELAANMYHMASALPRERIFDEFNDMLLGKKPSEGLQFLRSCGWINLFPELADLIGVPQSPKWHPEGDVWIHTLHGIDYWAENRTGDDDYDLKIAYAFLAHDFGKKADTFWNEEKGDWSSKGHAKTGVPLAISFLERLTNRTDFLSEIPPLVEYHLDPVLLHVAGAKRSAVARLARKVCVNDLLRVVEIDLAARPPLPLNWEPINWFREQAESINVVHEGPKPIVMGRHLIELGVEPGPGMGKILDELFELQIEEEFETLEQGLQLAREKIES